MWLPSKLNSQGPVIKSVQASFTSVPFHLSLLELCVPKPSHTAPEIPHTYAKCLRSLPGLPCLAEGAACGCGVMCFPINKECCQCLQLSKDPYTHPQEELSRATPLKKYLPPSFVPYHWREWDLCQCSVSGRQDCLCWICLCFVTGWSTNCKYRAGYCLSGISLFELTLPSGLYLSFIF